MTYIKGISIAAAMLATTATVAFAEAPTTLGIGVLLSTGPEAAWDGTFLRDLEATIEASPHDLDISYKNVNGAWGEEAGNAMDLFARSGQYQIIWGHSTYSDQVKELQVKYPEILFVLVGSGNEGLGGNAYWAYKRLHEPSYLLGVMAGELTESDVIGVVGQFPSEDVNDQINSFFAGASSVNADVQRKVAFIESWYDPAKAEQFTNAQIAAGADQIFQLVESFETCEKAGIMCYGNYVDQAINSPQSVVASATMSWSEDIKWVIDTWYDHASNGTPYDGNVVENWISMADGGTGLSGYHDYESRVSDDLKAKISGLSADITSGELVIPVDLSVPTSD